jgi:type IV pilus assembly protein PilO
MPSVQDRIQVTGRPIFGLFGVFLAAGYYLMNGNPVAPYESQIAQLHGEISKVQAKIKETESHLADKAKFQEEMERISQTFRLALDYLPKDLDIQDILKKVYVEARTAGVALLNFVPKEAGMKEFYDEVPLDIRLRGSYSQLVTFLANISKIPRIINVQDVDLDAPKFVDGLPIMEFKGTLVVYRYREGK